MAHRVYAWQMLRSAVGKFLPEMTKRGVDEDDVLDKMRRFCGLSAAVREELMLANEDLYAAFEMIMLPAAEKRDRSVNSKFIEIYERAKQSAEQPREAGGAFLLDYGSVDAQYDRLLALSTECTRQNGIGLIAFVRLVEQFKLWRESARGVLAENGGPTRAKEQDKILAPTLTGPYSFSYLDRACRVIDLVAKYPRLLTTALTHTDLISYNAALKKQCGLEPDFWTRQTVQDRQLKMVMETIDRYTRRQAGLESGTDENMLDARMGFMSCLTFRGGIRWFFSRYNIGLNAERFADCDKFCDNDLNTDLLEMLLTVREIISRFSLAVITAHTLEVNHTTWMSLDGDIRMHSMRAWCAILHLADKFGMEWKQVFSHVCLILSLDFEPPSPLELELPPQFLQILEEINNES